MQKPTKTRKPTNGGAPTKAGSQFDRILAAIKPGEEVRAADIVERLSIEPTRVNAALVTLVDTERLLRVDRGIYRKP